MHLGLAFDHGGFELKVKLYPGQKSERVKTYD